MNSERRHIGLVLVALATAACFQPQAPKPPNFPGGGLLAFSVAPPAWILTDPPAATYEEMVATLKGLEGVYVASTRFGNPVVVATTLTGNPYNAPAGSDAREMKATLSIFSSEKNAYALLEPGCLNATVNGASITKLVFEGHWRYLEESDPTPQSTGLIRLWTSEKIDVADPISTAICGGQPLPPGAVLTFWGATGSGEAAPDLPLTLTYQNPRKSRTVGGRQAFFVGAHHGGCQSSDHCGISENTPETIVLAQKMGGDYIEIDVRMTSDNQPVLFHLGLTAGAVQGTYCIGSVSDWTFDQLTANCRLPNGESIPLLFNALVHGLTQTNQFIWLDMKVAGAVVPSSQVVKRLQQLLVQCQPGTPPPQNGQRCLYPGSKPVEARVYIGLPSTDTINEYVTALEAGDLATGQRCLIEEDYDLLLADYSTNPAGNPKCVAFGPRYTRGPLADVVGQVQAKGFFAGYWTLNDPPTMDAFLTTGRPNGFLTNYLGTMNQRWEEVGILPAVAPGGGTP